jgi:medium-chain acyl-[acyl-carrier-protein] hydrolase
MIYHKWPQALEDFAEVHAAQLPGRESRLREPPLTRLTELCAELARAVLPFLDGRPFAFFGHSMGALLAFELARKLARETGREPVHLFVSGRPAPQSPRERRTFDLPEPEFIEELLSLNGTPREVLENAELRQLLLPTLRADFAACQTYEFEPGPPLGCPVTVFGGLQDEVGREQLEGWGEQTTAAFNLHMFPGDHFFLNTSQRPLLDLIARDLYRHARATR